jgi:hypothetical protein
MWYLDDSVANIETLGNDPKGDRNARERNPLKDFHLEPHNLADAEEKWNKFSQRICRRSNESP